MRPHFTAADRNRFTFDELVSTGNLALIDDPQLRQMLSRYYDAGFVFVNGYNDIRVSAIVSFGGILTSDQVFLNQDRSELTFSGHEALLAREIFLSKPEAINMLGPLAEMQLTLIGLMNLLRNEASELNSLLQRHLE